MILTKITTLEFSVLTFVNASPRIETNPINLYIYSNLYILMSDDKIQMPMSGGGLIRYSDEYKSKFKFSPILVIGIIILVLIIEFFLHRSNLI